MKRNFFARWTLLLCGSLLRAQLSVPQPGIARFADGSVRAIHGVPANLMVDSQTITTADVISFSDTGGLISSNGVIRLLRTDGKVVAEYPSGEPQPLLNVDSSLMTAVAWLPTRHLLLSWDGKKFAATPVDDSAFGGSVSFVRLTPSMAEFFVSLTNSAVARILVALPSGRLVSSEVAPGVHGKVFNQYGWMVSQSAHGLLAETPAGMRQNIPLNLELPGDGDLTIERMSDEWLHVYSQSTGLHWAILLSPTKLSVSQLPPPVSEAAK